MKEIQKEITNNLVWAAGGYARAGMGLMLGATELGRNAQAAIGNLAIATELLRVPSVSEYSRKIFQVELRWMA